MPLYSNRLYYIQLFYIPIDSIQRYYIKLHSTSISNSKKRTRKNIETKEKQSCIENEGHCFFPYCNFSSTNEVRLLKHINSKHNRIKILSSSFTNGIKKKNALNEKYKHLISISKLNKIHYKCNNCDKVYSSKYNLSVHIKTNHMNVKFSCEEKGCEMTFKHRCSLKKHIMHFHCKELNLTEEKEMTNVKLSIPLENDLFPFINNYSEDITNAIKIHEMNDDNGGYDDLNIFYDNMSFLDNKYLLEQLE